MSKNNFDIVRLFLATMVVLVHAATLSAVPELDYLHLMSGDVAVSGFFAISGYLIAKSYATSRSLYDYAVKRVLRIYPAYICVILFCVFIGFLVTTMKPIEYLLSPETFRYIFANLFFLNFLQPDLPGVFESNPISAMNGSLWTIKVEVALYFCLPLVIYLIRRFGRIVFPLIYLASVFWVIFFEEIYGGRGSLTIAKQFPGQISYFLVGVFLYLNPIQVKRAWLYSLISGLLFFVVDWSVSDAFFRPLCIGMAVIYLCLAFVRKIEVGKYGDFSYGIYVYHFPVIQIFVYMGYFDKMPHTSLLFVCCVVLILSVLSWHLVEKRFLKRKNQPAVNSAVLI